MNPESDNHKEMSLHDGLLGNRTTYDAFQEKARSIYWKQANECLFSKSVDAWWCDCTEPFEADWKGAVKPGPEERMIINSDEAKLYLDPASRPEKVRSSLRSRLVVLRMKYLCICGR